jgi:sugar phosphate isomerase/epimerase
MKVGMLTAPFGGEPLKSAVEFAAKVGFDCLEITTGAGSGHCDVTSGDAANAQAIAKLVRDAGVEISSFAYYAGMPYADGPTPNPTYVKEIRGVIDSASEIGVGVVCALTGIPPHGVSKHTVIKEWAPGVWPGIADYAKSKGIKIAFENWFATCLQSTQEFDMFFTAVPHETLGLNYDPSHLVHQGCDWLELAEKYASRIYHTHAKDCEVNERQLRYGGNLNGGWWRYVIPGYGKIHWGQYVATLRRCGVNNVLSIEHEDGGLGREEGFERGLAYLRQFA